MKGRGLSPLARGTRQVRQICIRYRRFIPAGAGNSSNDSLVFTNDAVYPRWRGELRLENYVTECSCGLSPLARGTPPAFPWSRRNTRFIPAGAGNSGSTACLIAFRSVYPRWRGELFRCVNNSDLQIGLSPLARGTPADQECATGRRRFIPAGAGNSTVQTAGYYFFAVYPRWRGELKSGNLFNVV